MFLHVCVILFTGGSPGRPPWQGEPPGTRQTPPGTRQTPPRTRQTPPGRENHPPRTRQPPWNQATPPGPGSPSDLADHPPGRGNPPRTRQTPHSPRTRQTPPQEADCSIRSMSGRYASYWNAFLSENMIYRRSTWPAKVIVT